MSVRFFSDGDGTDGCGGLSGTFSGMGSNATGMEILAAVSIADLGQSNNKRKCRARDAAKKRRKELSR